MIRRSLLLAAGLAACDDDTPATADAGPDRPDMQLDAEPPAECVDDSNEDDDTYDDAAFVVPGEGPIVGVLCPDDEDVVAFDAEAPCPMRLVLEHAYEEGDLDVLVVDAFGERIASGDSADDDEVVEVDLPEAGEYYAIVYGYEGAGAAYTLSIDVDGHDGGDGLCAPIGQCSTGYAIDDLGECFDCAAGYRDGGDGSCVPEGTCARGHADGGDGECWPVGTCAPDHHPTLDQGCAAYVECAEGRDDGTGVCAAECAAGFHDGGDGRCVPVNGCGLGFQLGGDDTCRPLDDCAAGFEPNAAGVCQAALDCSADGAGAGFDDAAPLPLGESVYGIICPEDVDLFAVDLDSPCPAAIRLSFAHAEGDLDLEWVLDLGDRNDGGEVLDARASASDDEYLPWTGAGRFYARVFGYFGDETVRYAIRVDAAGHDGGDGSCQPFGVCAMGYAIDERGACSRCAEGFRDGGDGSCVAEDCAEGFHDGGDGRCVPLGRCAPGFDDDGTGRCAEDCAAGFHDGGGACVAEGTCRGDRIIDGGRCVCPPGSVEGGAGTCTPPGTCADGFHDGGDGRCIPEDRCAEAFVPAPGLRCRAPLDCGDQIDDGVAACADGCAPGAHDGGDGACIADGACSDGFHDGGDGTCIAVAACVAGAELDAAGLCHPALSCPADDPGEPDARWSDARPLAPGETARGIVCPGDDDLFVVEQSPDCTTVARLDFAGAEADLSLSLLAGPDGGVEGAGSGPLAASRDDENRERLVIPPGPTGTVYLRVDALPGQGAAYRLRLDEDGDRCGRDVRCMPGQHPDGAGGCAPEGICAPGHVDGGDGRCLPVGRCALGFHDGGDGSCVAGDRCAPGHHLLPAGTCVETTACPGDLRDDGLGVCSAVCAGGFVDGGDGCVAAGACSMGFHDGGDGGCLPLDACADGFAADGAGRCLADLACPADDAEGDEPIPLAPDATVDGITCPEDGMGDHYAIDPPADCRFSALLRFAHADGDLALALVTANGEILDRADSGTDDERLVPGDLDGEVGLQLRVEPAAGVRYRLSYRCD